METTGISVRFSGKSSCTDPTLLDFKPARLLICILNLQCENDLWVANCRFSVAEGRLDQLKYLVITMLPLSAHAPRFTPSKTLSRPKGGTKPTVYLSLSRKCMEFVSRLFEWHAVLLPGEGKTEVRSSISMCRQYWSITLRVSIS